MAKKACWQLIEELNADDRAAVEAVSTKPAMISFVQSLKEATEQDRTTLLKKLTDRVLPETRAELEALLDTLDVNMAEATSEAERKRIEAKIKRVERRLHALGLHEATTEETVEETTEDLLAPDAVATEQVAETATEMTKAEADYRGQLYDRFGFDIPAETQRAMADAVLEPGSFYDKFVRVANIVGGEKYAYLNEIFYALRDVFNPRVRLSLVPHPQGANIAGLYSNNSFTLFPRGMRPKTFIHESVHGITVAQIERAERLIQERRPGTWSEEDRQVVRAYERMAALMRSAEQQANGRPFTHPQVFRNVAEFVAEAWSNPEFQKFLMETKSIPGRVKSATLWEKFISNIKRMLVSALMEVKGDKEVQAAVKAMEDSLLGEVLDLSGEFMSRDNFTSERTYAETSREVDERRAVAAPNSTGAGVNGAAMAGQAPAARDPVDAIRELGVRLSGEYPGHTEAPQQLTHGATPKKPGGKLLTSVSAAAKDPRVKEKLRKAYKLVRDALREVSTVRFDAALSAGFSAIVNLGSAYNEFKSVLRTRFNIGIDPIFAKLQEEELALVNDMIFSTTINKMRLATDKMVLDWVNSGKPIYTVKPGMEGAAHPELVPNPELVAMGKYTQEEFIKGVQSELGGYGTVKYDPAAERTIRRQNKQGEMEDVPAVWTAYNAVMDTLAVAAAERLKAVVESEQGLVANQLDATLRKHIADEAVRARYARMVKVAGVMHQRIRYRSLEDGADGRKRPSAEAIKEADALLFDKDGKANNSPFHKLLRGEGADDVIDALVAAASEKDEKGNILSNGVITLPGEDTSLTLSPEFFKEFRAAALAEKQRLKDANKEGVTVNDVQEMLDEARAFAELRTKVIEAKRTAVQTIMGGYVPLHRNGKYRVVFEYRDKDGNYVSPVAKYKAALPYFHNDDVESYLRPLADDWNTTHGNTEFEVEVANPKAGEKGEPATLKQTVRIVAREPEGVPDKQATTQLPYDEIIRTLDALNEKVPMQLRVALIKKMTSAEDFHRRGLRREVRPGFSFDARTVVSQHLQALTAMIAHKHYYPRMNEIVSGDARTMPKYWGDGRDEIAKYMDEYKRVLARAGGNKSDATVMIAHRELVQVAESYFGQGKLVNAQLALAENPGDAKLAEKVKTLRAEAINQYKLYAPDIHRRARRYVDWLNESGFDDDPTHWRTFKSVSTVIQLGASFSTALTNLTSLPLHTFAALASYNTDTGFGGGFGGARSFKAITSAFSALLPLAKETFVEGTLGNKTYPENFFRKAIAAATAADGRKYLGYDAAAWQFMLELSESGALGAQRYNEMMGQANRAAYGDKLGKYSSQMMSMFVATEELNRATTALAAYSLYREQYEATGVADPAKMEAFLREQVEKMVFATQGDYGMANRPRLFRGDVSSIIFMYKTFAVTTVELLIKLPPAGRAMFIGTLMAMSGTRGIPFWEELMAILDGVTQKTGIGLGVTKGNAERAFTMALRDLGIDKAVLDGAFDSLTGIHMFGRAGVQVGVPLVGMLRAGADFEKELGKALGPAVGIVSGGIKAGSALAKGDVETALRQQPVSGIRHLVEAYTYAKYDAVLNKRSQVVLDGVSPAQIIARALGFYPQEVNEANNMVRLENYTRVFAKELKAQYIEAGLRAKHLRDPQALRDIMDEVREHNAMFRGTALEITDFAKSLERGAKESERGLVARTVKTLPKVQRQEYERNLGGG